MAPSPRIPRAVPAVQVVPRVRRPAVDRARCARLLAFLVAAAARRRGAERPASGWGSVCALLVGNRGSAEAHRAVFGDSAPTDVISLSYDPAPGDESGPTGELIVNLDRALAEGRRRAGGRRSPDWGPDHELALYLAHGVDHLTGADDHESADRRRMRVRDLRWVAAAARRNLVSGLFPPPAP